VRAIVLRGWRLRQSGIRAGIDSLFSIAERERIHHAAQKRKTVTRPRRQGGEKKRQAGRKSRMERQIEIFEQD
jgi:hypothetical protein